MPVPFEDKRALIAFERSCSTRGTVWPRDHPADVYDGAKGAACTVNRQGTAVGLIKPTPGKVGLSRSKENVILNCNLDGYEQSNEVLVASFTGATWATFCCGPVGVAIDAASGANNKYPERVMVILTPASLPSDDARDAHYAGIRQRIESRAPSRRSISSTPRCSSNNRELCTIEAKQMSDARDKALADLDQRRLAAKVVPG